MGKGKENKEVPLFSIGDMIYLKDNSQSGRAPHIIVVVSPSTWSGFKLRTSQFESKCSPH